jgi:hypothetical protein
MVLRLDGLTHATIDCVSLRSRPKAGGRALITVGPFSGFFVDVSRVKFGRVWWEIVGGIKGEAPMTTMRAAE